jgi:hypothetical protein
MFNVQYPAVNMNSSFIIKWSFQWQIQSLDIGQMTFMDVGRTCAALSHVTEDISINVNESLQTACITMVYVTRNFVLVY